jgi:predicted dinucleotide-binding enzyme
MKQNKIGIIGSGPVGLALANGFLKHGYSVMIGSRDSSKLADWKAKAGSNGYIGNFSETAGFGGIIVLAVKGNVAKEAIMLAGVDRLSGKTVIDVTNPIADAPPVNGVIKFFTSLDRSQMEDLQEIAPNAHFVKAFNSIGNAFMVNPGFKTKPSMFICGNNDKAKKEVAEIVELFGFEVEDMGQAESARAIEPLCMLWCIPGLRENKWANAFKFLKM